MSDPLISPELLKKLKAKIRELEILNDEIANRALRHQLSEKIVGLGKTISEAARLT